MRESTFCDGMSRRDMLRIGTASFFGTALTLPQFLAAKEPGSTKDVSLIFLFLHGGLSTIDTFDLKPDAPAEFRGEFNPIATNVSGVQVCEHLPHVAKAMDHISLLRSFQTRLERNRLAYPLFDTDRYRRHIEAAYRKMWELWQHGERPRNPPHFV